MSTDIEILSLKELMALYDFSRKEVTRLLRTKGCPVLPRVEGAPYKVVKDEFETWLRTRRV